MAVGLPNTDPVLEAAKLALRYSRMLKSGSQALTPKDSYTCEFESL